MAISLDIKLVTNAKKFRIQLIKGLTQELQKLFLSKKNNILTQVRQIIINAVAQSEAFRALQGAFPNDPARDLQAHFGLSSSDAERAAQNILEVVGRSVVLETGSGGSGVLKINIHAIERSFTEFLNVPGGTFISEPSGATVPWITWLLVNPNVDLPKGFNIVFTNGLSSQDIRSSRSGRALMKSLDSIVSGGISVGGIYAIPEIGRGGAQNFISKAINSNKVRAQIIDILSKNLGLRRS